MIASPQFRKKSEAEEWYRQMVNKKVSSRNGLRLTGKNQIKLIDYCRGWLDKRELKYPASTVSSDEQRLRDYILPFLAEYPIASITREQIKGVLEKISEPGFIPTLKGRAISDSTRTRVHALVSVIFSDALNADPPLVQLNPAHGIKLDGKRTGKKRPKYLASKEECLLFLETAKKMGQRQFITISIILMSGLRKQELIALRWRCFNAKQSSLLLSEKYEQKTGLILKGTKAGEFVEREIPIPAALVALLVDHRKTSGFARDFDFVLTREDGSPLHARMISRFIEQVRTKCGLSITTHGLRHTYGREFILKTGNSKALQAILGHSSSATTDIYSDIAGSRIRGFGESVSFDVGVDES